MPTRPASPLPSNDPTPGHSPLPWHVDGTAIGDAAHNPQTVATTSPRYCSPGLRSARANAAYIVQAANAYPALLAALREARELAARIAKRRHQDEDSGVLYHAKKVEAETRAALAQAGETV